MAISSRLCFKPKRERLADFTVQAHRPIAKSGRAPLAFGAEIFLRGGQDKDMRMDVAPNAHVNVSGDIVHEFLRVSLYPAAKCR